ncbi:MAG: anaerobic ribonucleoside-triphosphate reductase activating protein [Clostridium sp.]
MNNKVNLAGIIHESLNNGPGIRRVLFAQGCRHNCKGCFNPHTHGFGAGKDYDIDSIIKDIKRNPLISGVTFSGGDPLEQSEAFAKIAEEIKKNNKNIWCYTGYKFEYILQNINEKPNLKKLIDNIDVLVDGKFDSSLKDEKLKYRGSKNQRIIDVKKSLKNNSVIELHLD